MKIKVLISDNNSFIREGMKLILSSFEDLEVVATAQNVAQAVNCCRRHEFDFAMLRRATDQIYIPFGNRAIAEIPPWLCFDFFRLLFPHLFKLAGHCGPSILDAFNRTGIFETGLFEMKVNLSSSKTRGVIQLSS
ncbi:response regulator transcription factor [Paenibacillus thailandensis]|uniref:Response regulator transcription factor n=1 Tax=Paenibacillus thailandensis TaxID=393250 RepID=A0ABW5QTD2_9BACL